jgi:hypothetical protein
MKNRITFFCLFITAFSYAQSPQAFKYQAALRDLSGLPLIEKNVSIRISILKTSLSGTSIYSEIHQAKTTASGIINLEIGKGVSALNSFSSIEWGTDSHFVKIEMDAAGGSNFELVGISQLLSVPYALYAEKSGDEKWDESSSGISYAQGNVGIGTTDPNITLEISGKGELDLLKISNENNSSGVNNYVFSNTNFHAPAFISSRSRGTILAPLAVQSGDRLGGLYGRPYLNGEFQYSAAIQMYVGLNPGISSFSSTIRFETTGINEITRLERMRISENGNVGIGIINPSYKLDVGGLINSTGILINGQPISNSNPWTLSGSNIFYNTGRVGIGTATPAVKLDVDGGGDLNVFNLRNNSNSLGLNTTVSSDTDFHASAFVGKRSRGTFLNPLPVLEGDRITGIYGSLFANGNYQNAAGIQFYVGANPNLGSYPVNIRFETTSTNSIDRIERLRVSETGNIIVKTGDVLIENVSSGVIMKSPNGQCWRMTVSNSGTPVFSVVPCPQ